MEACKNCKYGINLQRVISEKCIRYYVICKHDKRDGLVMHRRNYKCESYETYKKEGEKNENDKG